MVNIKDRVRSVLKELPQGVELVAAAKSRNAVEIEEAVEAGIRIIGENYIQEAEEVYPQIRERVKWHFIGKLQRNKVKKAVKLFDMIETVDSEDLAREIDARAFSIGKVMDVLIEMNSGDEEQKSGVFADDVEDLIRNMAVLKNLKVRGIMTMGPLSDDLEELRPYFKTTKDKFEHIRSADIPGVEMKYLSMGMSASYRIAIEEGANLVRIGTGIFGERNN